VANPSPLPLPTARGPFGPFHIYILTKPQVRCVSGVASLLSPQGATPVRAPAAPAAPAVPADDAAAGGATVGAAVSEANVLWAREYLARCAGP